MKGSDLSAFVTTFIRIVGSAIAGDGAVTVGGFGSTGALGGDVDDPDDGEAVTDATVFGGLGLIFRPRTPKKIGDQLYSAESFGVKKGDETTPWTWRDLRLHKRFPAPKEGTIALVGYGGGFLSFSDVPSSEDGTVQTLYCPYAFSGGAPTKAHAILLDPTPGNESISITHGSGYQVSLTEQGVNVNIDSGTFLSMTPGTFTVNAAKIILQGNVAVGHNAAAAVPFSGGPAMPPSSSFFYSTP